MIADTTLIITSGRYVGPELAAEFGRIPPAFLPVGNRRLYQWQIAETRAHFARIILSLPCDFELPPFDRNALERAGVVIARVDASASLRDVLRDLIGDLDGAAIAVLHGDTLLRGVDYGQIDAMSVDVATAYYPWAVAQVEQEQILAVDQTLPDGGIEQSILTGFFYFGNRHNFLECLDREDDFVAAIDRYLNFTKMLALPSQQWLDFGHLHTYYTSRGMMTTERAFNSLKVDQRIVNKTSRHPDRIIAEAGWYEHIPLSLRMYTPRYLGRSDEGYGIEFLYNASLADLFVFGDLPALAWRGIFQACEAFVDECRHYAAPSQTAATAQQLFLPKTLARLADHAAHTGIDLDRPWSLNGRATPSLLDIARQAAARIEPARGEHLSVVHGDLCFSNILYDFRSRSIRVIDPRGQNALGQPSIYGDNRYDLAKLHHSVHGLYDVIVGGMAHVAGEREAHTLTLDLPVRSSQAQARALFDQMTAARFHGDAQSVEAISLLLFLSMLPLHADDPTRQWALLANALRLHLEQTEHQ